jgi:hypothetical protein
MDSHMRERRTVHTPDSRATAQAIHPFFRHFQRAKEINIPSLGQAFPRAAEWFGMEPDE